MALQSIRDKTQGWFAWLIVGAIALTMGLFGVEQFFSGGANPTIVKVNGEKIDAQQLNIAIERFNRQRQLYALQGLDLPTLPSDILREVALQQLINEAILDQANKKNGYILAPQIVQQELLSNPTFAMNGKFSADLYQQYLSALYYTPESFFKEYSLNLIANQQQAGIYNSNFVLANEVNDLSKLYNQQRDIEYIIISPEKFADDVHITTEQAEAYYQQQQQQFAIAQQVSLEYVRLRPDAIKVTPPTAEQLKQFYQENSALFTTPQYWQIARILITEDNSANPQQTADVVLEKIAAGENFADLAKQYSADNETANKGGVLPKFSWGGQPAQIEQVVQLLKVGETSPAIQTNEGIVIIKLIAEEPATAQAYDAVIEQVRESYLASQRQQTYNLELDRLTDLAFRNPTTLDNIITSMGLQPEYTDLFSRVSGEDDITSNPQVINAAFSDSLLAGYNSEAIVLADDSIVIARVAEYKPQTYAAFADVQQSIEQQLSQQAMRAAVEAYAADLLHQLQTGVDDLQQLAKQANSSLQRATKLNRRMPPADDMPAAIINETFNIPVAADHLVGGVLLPSNEYAIIKITNIQDGETLGEEEAEQLKANLDFIFGEMDYNQYNEYIVNNAKIKTY